MSQTLTYVIGSDRRALVDSIQDFKVDFSDDNNNWIQARQFERGMRQVFVNVTNEDGTPFDLTGCNVWFEGLLPKTAGGDFRVIDSDGYVPLDPSAGKFRFDMPGHAFTVAGSYRQAFFRIVKNGNSVTTLEFDLDVLADKVIDGLVPKDWIGPFETIADQLVDDLQKHTDAADKIISDFQQKVTDLVNQLNQQGSTTTSMLTELQNRITDLETKIKQDGLFTQAEAEAFEQKILSEIKQQQDDLISQLNASSQEALYASQTDWIAPLPDYMASNWAGVVNAIPHGQNIFNFGLITDNHFQFDNLYSYRSLDHYVWFGEATRRANVDAVLVDGDNINGDNYSLTYAGPNRKQLIKSTLTVVDVLEGSVDALTPVFWIKGNHDNGMMNEIGISGPKSTLSEEDLKHFYHTTDCRYGEVRDGDSLYFYKDYPEQKIRLIGLNSNDDTDDLNPDGSWKTKGMDDHKFRQPQLEWLVSQALKVDDPDYQVIFFFHVPLDHVPLDPAFKNTNLQNTDAFIQIIKCFKAGTSTTINADGKYPITGLNVDFTKQGPRTIVGIFNGHLHLDASNTTALDGTPVIEQTSSTIRAHAGVRPKNTINEDAWSIFSIDTEKRQIHMYRFGNGNDQSFSY